ncbi:MAG: pyruvate kinase [Candidatus Binatia bacterium]
MPEVTPIRSARARRRPHARPPGGSPWSVAELRHLARELRVIRADLLRLERRFATALRDAHPAFRRSARNLVHYLALRRHDIRPLQERLAILGLSSLGRTESHVMAGLDAVLHILDRLAERCGTPTSAAAHLSLAEGNALLAEHTEALLGPRSPARGVRMMVTMPSQAADDYGLVRQLLAHGMDCMRINCAHDDAAAWRRMVGHLRRARRELGRDCRVLMDLGGPKLRTGPIDPSSQVLRWRPQRDGRGTVAAPAQVWLTALERPLPPPEAADACLHLPAAWLQRTKPGLRLAFTDLRGKARTLRLAAAADRRPAGRPARRRCTSRRGTRCVSPTPPAPGTGARREPGDSARRLGRGALPDAAPRRDAASDARPDPGPSRRARRARPRAPAGGHLLHAATGVRRRPAARTDLVRRRQDRRRGGGGHPRPRPAGAHHHRPRRGRSCAPTRASTCPTATCARRR